MFCQKPTTNSGVHDQIQIDQSLFAQIEVICDIDFVLEHDV